MDKYSYKDVIIDPEDPRVEIGAEYYWGESPRKTIDRANNKGGALPLLSIDREEEHTFPFYFFQGSLEGGSHFLIRKKESSYVERQAKWLADNDIKVGDYVRVTGKADSLEDGWQTLWNPDMDKSVGKVGTVSYISANFGECGIEVDVPDVGPYFYPYFVLENVEPKYVPFDLSNEEDRAKLRGAWIKYKFAPGYEYQITAVEIDSLFIHGDKHSPESLLEKCLFLDGTPCGKMEVKE